MVSSTVPVRFAALALSLAALLLLITGCGVQPIFSYQGLLTDSSGTPVADGTYNADFRIFQQATGGTAVWTEARTVTVADGLFDTEVGSEDVPAEIYSQPTWLEVSINGETLSPRQPLRGAPYAFSLASGAVVQGTEVLTRTLAGQPDTGAALAVVNFEAGDGGGHGLLGVNYSTNRNTAALAGIARDEAYGAYVLSTNYRGIYVESDPIWFAGYFIGGISVSGGCTGCAMMEVGQNVGESSIEPGDLVAVVGVTVDPDLGTPVMQVRRAQGGEEVIIGVASGAMRRTPVDAQATLRTSGFDPQGGSAAAGSYVAVTVKGLAQVRVAEGKQVALGDYLGASADGAGLQGSASQSIARVMSAPDERGLVWAMVGGQ